MTVKLEKKDGTATVTLDRPQKLNALSGEMYDKSVYVPTLEMLLDTGKLACYRSSGISQWMAGGHPSDTALAEPSGAGAGAKARCPQTGDCAANVSARPRAACLRSAPDSGRAKPDKDC